MGKAFDFDAKKRESALKDDCDEVSLAHNNGDRLVLVRIEDEGNNTYGAHLTIRNASDRDVKHAAIAILHNRNYVAAAVFKHLRNQKEIDIKYELSVFSSTALAVASISAAGLHGLQDASFWVSACAGILWFFNLVEIILEKETKL